MRHPSLPLESAIPRVLGVSVSGCLLWSAVVRAVSSHLACLALQLLVAPLAGSWEKLGILCDDWRQVTAVQDCQALPADTISAGSDEEENVLQQRTNIKQRGWTGVFLTCCFSTCVSFLFKSGRERQPFLWSWNATLLYRQERMVIFSVLVYDWLLLMPCEGWSRTEMRQS